MWSFVFCHHCFYLSSLLNNSVLFYERIPWGQDVLKPFDHCFIDEFHENLGFHGWICFWGSKGQQCHLLYQCVLWLSLRVCFYHNVRKILTSYTKDFLFWVGCSKLLSIGTFIAVGSIKHFEELILWWKTSNFSWWRPVLLRLTKKW